MAKLHGTQRFQATAIQALAFVETSNARLPAAMIRYQWFNGNAEEVVVALSTYQNGDGGFGKQLEPDIHHPSSNAFAARIAMQYLAALPQDTTVAMRNRLQTWLVENQHEDGDWHFSAESRSAFMQPWFAAWQHPALNPACCVTGLASVLGMATDQMLARTQQLFQAKASLDEISAGQFYNLLPYVEYSAGVSIDDSWHDALVNQITSMEFDDAEHFFTLALGGSSRISHKIPADVFTSRIDELLADQQEDGGWPTPYNEAWRVWSTAGNMMILAKLRGQEHLPLNIFDVNDADFVPHDL